MGSICMTKTAGKERALRMRMTPVSVALLTQVATSRTTQTFITHLRSRNYTA